tara:strand:+ start:6881 stop:7024 length:144 start_codon:yes stop_codon:yes gene_type:complete
VLELDNCNECNNGIIVIQLADGSLESEPCPCTTLQDWYNLHGIGEEE